VELARSWVLQFRTRIATILETAKAAA
jgi:hypothetical protein